MSYWEKNLAVLRDRYPELAARLETNRTLDVSDGQDDIRAEKTASGEAALIINGVHIHSNRDPAREGRRQAEALAADASGAVLILGFGLGYTAEAAADITDKTGRPLVIVERRPEIFTLALEQRDLSRFLSSGKPVFVIGGDPGNILGALDVLDQAGIRDKPVLVKNRALVSLSGADEAWYADLERRVNTWSSKDQINAATLRRFGSRWTKNLAANIRAIRDLPGVKGLARCLENNTPVFLAAAGPSLDQAGPHLKEIRERCLVVAVDTSLRFLLAKGINPDFTVSVDPQFWNARHLYRLEASCLVAESAVYPPVLRSGLFRRAFLCRSLFPLGRFIEDKTDPKGALGAGGSVATTAWDFARLLGPSKIWIAGLDLAFPGLATHFKGALFEENVHAESGRLLPPETRSLLALESGFPFPALSASGKTVLTDRRLSMYGSWFENRIGREKEPVSYRLSGEGLAVQGFVSAPYEELLALPPGRKAIDKKLGAVFEAIDGAFALEQDRREQRYAAAMRSLVNSLETVCGQAEKAEKLAEEALHNRRAAETILEKLGAVNQAIAESPVKDAAGFLFPPARELEARIAENDPMRRHLEFSSLFYRELAGAARRTLSFLRKTP